MARLSFWGDSTQYKENAFRSSRRDGIMNQLLNLQGKEFAIQTSLNIWALYNIATLNFFGILSKTLECKNIYWSPISATGGPTVTVRLLFYKQKIRPVIAYVFPMKSEISSAQMKKLRFWNESNAAALSTRKVAFRPRLSSRARKNTYTTVSGCMSHCTKMDGKNFTIQNGYTFRKVKRIYWRATGRLTVKVRILIYKQKIKPIIAYVFPI